MRIFLVLMATTALAACGGGGAQTAGGTAVGQSTGTGTGGATGTPHTFVASTATKTYQAQGAVQAYDYTYNELLRYTRYSLQGACRSSMCLAIPPISST